MLTGKSYIGSQLSRNETKTFKTFNPQLNAENPTVFFEATSNEVNQAVQLAAQAFKTYRNISGSQKAAFLNAVADEILKLGDILLKMYCQESGLSISRAESERERTIGHLRMFANLVQEGSWVQATIDTSEPSRVPNAKPDIRNMLMPLGPVVVFGASNFPLAYSTAGGDTVSALAAGCPVIVKSHAMHAGTGELVAAAIIQAVEKTNMPHGVFSNLNSGGIEVGQQLVKHPEVKAVGFTGSITGGRALYDLAAKREVPIPVFAEMGSINPVVILPEALRYKKEAFANTLAKSMTTGTGQFCTNPGLIIGIKNDFLDDFIVKLSEEVAKISPSCMLHPNIKAAFRKGKSKALEQDGLRTEVVYTDNVKPNYAKQMLVSVEGQFFLNNKILHEEVFGPYSIVVKCKDKNEMEMIISNLEGQLTGTIIAENNEMQNYMSIVEALQNRVGRIIFNGVPTGVEVCNAMVHGGPYPASSDSRFTAVGINAIKRWVRPFCYQNWPDYLLPDALKNENPLGLLREVDTKHTKSSILV
ncbi:aldehyde dehydrogenase [Pseudalgibacter alginicilyticus]|uniref:Aldehyde dehydrogenase n=1 Tax=Pseudalgibacter alginicilyticus TaxID=1736674 RepID=A0A0P0CIG0_9FLAO|nr:aldehyde dehydrogenase (NADP(+)) [Pseudalgibacter alginicilyticus]ALJ05961.1 aldehyde dehydrogenase [Pseudalgibacter alginicilyticus]